MIIIIEKTKLYFAEGLIDDIHRKYKDKIRSVYRRRRKILFNNGDELKVVSIKQQLDGLYADIAMGPHAKYLTLASKYKKPIWDLSDLENYLENL